MRFRAFRLNGSVLYIVLAIVLIWPTVQLLRGSGGNAEHHGNAEKLLYEVSLFQLEMLGSQLSNLNPMTQTSALDGVKSAVYSVSFTHERVRSALGEDVITDLDGMPQLLQYVMRLQLGASRPLKSEEVEVFREASKLLGEMYAAYEKLLTTKEEIVPTQNKILSDSNSKLRKLLQNK
ncbi:S-adenosylmethionine decarboxylase [Paenibacillus sp. N1-5-1-14]|uniref:S-adenosylmethionine decarboxylase n=1 Tax=Paenibacillus radicibacter TaxID=2972488 RepID=UPI002159AF2D|nr:S-adenosylmethionine decarboxylase [Paenibacillus radicibacter]MCR8644181.1 S-adenosylmethionine decarboxylase [Paenibacillus radicibacter]